MTDKGRKIKKKICLEDGIPFSYNEPENIDWHAYGWCLTGTQKKVVLLAMDNTPSRQVEIKNKVREKYRNLNDNPGITFQNLNDILQLMLKRKIASMEEKTIKKHKKKQKYYKLTTKGLRIRELLLDIPGHLNHS